jgi:hypothetical protein
LDALTSNDNNLVTDWGEAPFHWRLAPFLLQQSTIPAIIRPPLIKHTKFVQQHASAVKETKQFHLSKGQLSKRQLQAKRG